MSDSYTNPILALQNKEVNDAKQNMISQKMYLLTYIRKYILYIDISVYKLLQEAVWKSKGCTRPEFWR